MQIIIIEKIICIAPSLDKIYFFVAAGFPDQTFPAIFFYKYEFCL